MHSEFPNFVRQWLERKCEVDGKYAKAVELAGGLDASVELQTKKIVETLYNVTSDEFYVVSFCSEPKDDYTKQNGLLSQWRAYGSQCGIAVHFQTDGLEKLLGKETKAYSYSASYLDSVVYQDNADSIAKEILPRLNRVFDFTAKISDTKSHEDIPMNEASTAFADFIYCTTFFKHHGFKEEDEARFVATRNRHTKEFIVEHEKSGTIPLPEKPIKFRVRNSLPIPYLGIFESLKEELPITKVLIGPGKNKELVAKAARLLIGNKNIEVAVSEIPFV
jgi:Protein of unknown function (DUF2971)